MSPEVATVNAPVLLNQEQSETQDTVKENQKEDAAMSEGKSDDPKVDLPKQKKQLQQRMSMQVLMKQSSGQEHGATSRACSIL